MQRLPLRRETIEHFLDPWIVLFVNFENCFQFPWEKKIQCTAIRFDWCRNRSAPYFSNAPPYLDSSSSDISVWSRVWFSIVYLSNFVAKFLLTTLAIDLLNRRTCNFSSSLSVSLQWQELPINSSSMFRWFAAQQTSTAFEQRSFGQASTSDWYLPTAVMKYVPHEIEFMHS